MNPSTNSTPKQEDPSQNWDQYPAGAAFCYGPRYNQITSHTDWEWENPMLLTQNSATCTGDQEMAECKPNMLADTLGSSFHQFNDIFPGAFPSTLTHNAWGMLNFTGIRDVGDSVEASPQIYQALSTPFHNTGFEALGNCTFPAGNISSGDHRLIEQKQFLGNLNQDARGMHDFLRREIYSSLDLSGKVGLNLGGRTYFSSEEDYSTLTRFGKRLRPYSPAAQAAPMCQAEGCKADLHIAKHYHRRHKVCEFHSKASSVIIGGQTQRFCQQCSRFHALSEFDDGKRSCRKRLADHNRRRRKPQSHSPSSTNANSADHKRTTLSAAESRDPNKYHASPEHKREDITMSLVTSVSDVIEEEKPLVCRGSAKRSTYDHYLRKNGCTGPSLSLSSLGGSDTSLTTQRQSSGQGQDLSVSWLGPMGAKASPDEVVDRSAFQILEKARGSSTLQALPHVTQNLLQIQSRPQDHAIPHTGWMMDIGCHEHEHEHLHELDLHQSAQRKSQSQNMLSLFEVREWNDPRTQNRQHGAVPLECVMEHQPLTSTNLNDVPHCHSMMADEQGLALEELGGLRSFNQSLYH